MTMKPNVWQMGCKNWKMGREIFVYEEFRFNKIEFRVFG